MPKIFRHTTHTRPVVTEDQIAHRAYQLWQDRGCPVGDGAEDWQAAQVQLDAETSCHRQGILRRLFTRIRQRAA